MTSIPSLSYCNLVRNDMLAGNSNNFEDNDLLAKPYCDCWKTRSPVKWKHLNKCECGEENDLGEWNWEPIYDINSVVVSEDKKQLTFHPVYSSGTAVVRGDTGLKPGYHYYWEVKILSDAYGTDVMVGLGTNKVNIARSAFMFTSLLGEDAESYGLSYRGTIHHDAKVSYDSTGFCKGSIVGVRVDLWQGTLEFYINRVPQGVSFFNLRRHSTLFPMVCSTAAQSSMRLIYTGSWRASLLVDAAKVLALAVNPHNRQRNNRNCPQQYLDRPESALLLPPGLWNFMRSRFWMTMPSLGCIIDKDDHNDIPMKDALTPQELLDMDLDMSGPTNLSEEPSEPAARQRSFMLFAPAPLRDRAGPTCRADHDYVALTRKSTNKRKIQHFDDSD